MSTAIDISGLGKAEVLAALYNASSPMGMGVFQARAGNMTVAQAQAHIDAAHYENRTHAHQITARLLAITDR